MRDLSGMRVCFVAGTLGLGGAERQLFYIMSALRSSGTVVELLTLTRGEYWEARIRQLGVAVQWVGAASSRLCRLWRIAAELRRRRPHVVQSGHFFTNLYAAGAARPLGIPAVGAIRNDTLTEVAANGRVLGRASLHVPRMLAANSRAGIRNAIALGVAPHRLHMLPNVVDTDCFRPAPRPTRRPVHLVAVGVRAQKRVDRLLYVLDALRARTTAPVTTTIVGDGPSLAGLQRQAAAMGLGRDRVHFRGGEAVSAEIYRNADVLVLTSDFEGTPNVVLEAMASGLPVVASRVGGVPEIVQDRRTGRLIERSDIEGFAAALASLVEDEGLRQTMGAEGRAHVERHHAVGLLPPTLRAMYTAAIA